MRRSVMSRRPPKTGGQQSDSCAAFSSTRWRLRIRVEDGAARPSYTVLRPTCSSSTSSSAVASRLRMLSVKQFSTSSRRVQLVGIQPNMSMLFDAFWLNIGKRHWALGSRSQDVAPLFWGTDGPASESFGIVSECAHVVGHLLNTRAFWPRPG